MKTITLRRTFRPPQGPYTIGHLYDGDGKYICDTIEDTDRGLRNDMTAEAVLRFKVKAKTAIPTGTYALTIDVVSPKFSLKKYYMDYCCGKVPRILNVPGFEGILMHMGSSERSSAGCVIVGYNTVKGRVTNSQAAYERLYRILQRYRQQGHKLYIKIV